MTNNKPINRIDRDEVEWFKHRTKNPDGSPVNALNEYQRIAITSAIYPGKGTPFGLMYAALGLAEAGEVQNKVKKAFRDDDILTLEKQTGDPGEEWYHAYICDLTPERRAQIIKELGGVLWYIAAVCDEIGANMSDVALQNLEELCSRGERGTLQGDGDDR
jgi:NTP pyrophosphatase (non-canonical NTP hydrolase)